MTSNRPLYQQQDPELRRLKEAFVSNLPGTTKWEVFCVLSSLPLCLLTAAYIEARVAARVRSSHQLSKQQWQVPKFAFEFAGVVLPLLLLLMSVAPAEPAFLLLFLLWGSLALKLWMRLAHGPGCRQHMAHMLQHMTCSRKRFVSAFRGGVMLATCLAILGVDFRAFPRRYAKAEGYGGGVMDLGVGAIIFAGGLVAAVSNGAAAAAAADPSGVGSSGAPGSTAAAGKRKLARSMHRWILQLLRGIKAAIPLLLLGGAREVATAIVGYQAHLGEYGLNWNFFYTIAAVTLLTLAVPVPPRWLGPLGCGLTAAHQLLLSLDLSKALPATAAAGSIEPYLRYMPGFLEGSGSSNSTGSSRSSDNAAGSIAAAATGAAKRVASLGAWLQLELGVEARQAAGFWASNKEGLGSLPGYWALYLLGAAVGHQLGLSCVTTAARARAQLSSSGSSSRPGGAAAAVAEAGRLVWAWVGVWWVVDLGVWCLLAAVEAAVEPVSRRTCNLPYVLWTVAQCLAWLLLVVMADLLTAVICSSSGGCGTSSGSSSGLCAPPAAAATAHGSSSSGGKGSSRRSIEAVCGQDAAAGVHGSAVLAAGSLPSAGQAAMLPPSPRCSGLQRRSVGRRAGGSSPVAAAAAGTGSSSPGGVSTVATVAAAAGPATAVGMESQQHSGSSTEGSPRKPYSSRSAAGAAPGTQGSVSPKNAPDKGSPKGGGGPDSGSSSTHSIAGAGSNSGSTHVRSRRHGSRLQPQHHHQPQPPHHHHHQQQQQQQQGQAPGVESSPASSSTSSSSSGGPMRLMLAFNRNMLALFLLGNLLTGGINLGINTLAVGSWAARVIVGLYMLLLCGVAVLLDQRGITLKAW